MKAQKVVISESDGPDKSSGTVLQDSQISKCHKLEKQAMHLKTGKGHRKHLCLKNRKILPR